MHQVNERAVANELDDVFKALKFASKKHRLQKRKDSVSPYINHPIDVADILARVGGVHDVEILQAALLHDTVEDTDASEDELWAVFGENVAKLVMECTDDKSLPKEERKALQIEHAPHKSPGAKQIKIADKICNITDITNTPPPDWSLERRRKYLDWAEKVVAGLRGHNPALEDLFDRRLAEAREVLDKEDEQ